MGGVNNHNDDSGWEEKGHVAASAWELRFLNNRNLRAIGANLFLLNP
jgi:hypothetical protein